MSKTHQAQLSLLEVAPSVRAPKRQPGRRPASPPIDHEAVAAREAAKAQTTAHCARLLAELDRAVAAQAAGASAPSPGAAPARPRLTRAQEARMMHLARLFEAIEQVHEGSTPSAAPRTAQG